MVKSLFLCSFLFSLFKSFHMARWTDCSKWITVLYLHLWWSCYNIRYKKNGSLFWLIIYRARSYNMMVFVHLVSADPRQHLGWIKEIGFLLSAAVPPPKVKWPKVNQCHLSDASSPLGLRTKLKTKDFQKLKFSISLREASLCPPKGMNFRKVPLQIL